MKRKDERKKGNMKEEGKKGRKEEFITACFGFVSLLTSLGLCETTFSVLPSRLYSSACR